MSSALSPWAARLSMEVVGHGEQRLVHRQVPRPPLPRRCGREGGAGLVGVAEHGLPHQGQGLPRPAPAPGPPAPGGAAYPADGPGGGARRSPFRSMAQPSPMAASTCRYAGQMSSRKARALAQSPARRATTWRVNSPYRGSMDKLPHMPLQGVRGGHRPLLVPAVQGLLRASGNSRPPRIFCSSRSSRASLPHQPLQGGVYLHAAGFQPVFSGLVHDVTPLSDTAGRAPAPLPKSTPAAGG